MKFVPFHKPDGDPGGNGELIGAIRKTCEDDAAIAGKHLNILVFFSGSPQAAADGGHKN